MGFDTNKFTFSSKRCCNVNSNVLIINYSFTGYEKITNVFLVKMVNTRSKSLMLLCQQNSENLRKRLLRRSSPI